MRLRLPLDLWLQVAFDAIGMYVIAYWILPLVLVGEIEAVPVRFAKYGALLALSVVTLSGVYSYIRYRLERRKQCR